MPCENCDPSTMYSGKLVLTDKKGNCRACGKKFERDADLLTKAKEALAMVELALSMIEARMYEGEKP